MRPDRDADQGPNRLERLQAIADKYGLGATKKVTDEEVLLEVSVSTEFEHSDDAIEELTQEHTCAELHFGEGGVSSMIVLVYDITEDTAAQLPESIADDGSIAVEGASE